MKVILQRVSEATVTVDGEKIAAIGNGLLVLLGIMDEDGQPDIDWICNKIINLRIFPDTNNVMNLSLKDTEGEIIVVSQFTLHASTKKGNRPSYIKAAKPNIAIPVYNDFIKSLKMDLGTKVQTGEFGADMKVQLVNDGPVTLIIDSKHRD